MKEIRAPVKTDTFRMQKGFDIIVFLKIIILLSVKVEYDLLWNKKGFNR